jgi:PAS domain S-box-containing protein
MENKTIEEFDKRSEEAGGEIAYYKRLAEESSNIRLRETEELSAIITELKNTQSALQRARDELERRVEERTSDLISANLVLKQEISERKEIGRAMQESEAWLRSIMDNTSNVIFVKDLAGRYITVNRRYEELFNVPRQSVLGKSDYDIFPNEYADKFRKHDLLVLEKGNTLEIEELVPHNDGLHTYISVKFPLLSADGKPYAVCAIATDITDRKRAEEALQESEQKYRELVENANSIILRWSPQGNITFLNEFGLRFFGYTEGEVIGRHIVGTIVPESESTGRDLRPLLDSIGVNPKDFEQNINENMRRNGERVWISWTNKAVLGRGGEVLEVLSIGSDITERRKAEEKVQNEKNKLDSIIAAMTSGLTIRDNEYRLIYQSPLTLGIFGNRVGEKCYKVFQDRETICDHCPVELALQDGKSHTIVTEVKLPDGTISYWENIANPIRDSSGTVVSCLEISTNITERKQVEEEKRNLEERLRRAEKMEALGQLAGRVAHDLNNVLGVLTGYSELLLLEIPEASRSRGHIDKILQSTEKGAAIIQDLLTLARRGVTVSEVINLNNVVSDYLKAPVFEKTKDDHPVITFRTECDPYLLNMKGSPVHLEKTLMNLVSNAAEAISGAGEVTILTESRHLDKPVMGYDEVKAGDYIVLVVSDTGMGIPAEQKGKIFEPFYTKKKMGRSGTGLGLAIVWGTVKDHNGYIDIQTEVGKGTSFTLYFPVAREELIAPRKKESIERYLGNGESVLIVDDNEEQREIAEELLTKLGYKVHLVSSGENAVEYIQKNKADMLVIDMIMTPGIDGLETYQRILKLNPHQKAIIVSGFAETDRIREAQTLGAGAYVKKPYIMEKIGVAIRDELARK